MDCEEDASSLLSLSHSLLPSENSSAPTTSTEQLNSWPGQDADSGMAGNFSPVSPPSGYSNLNHMVESSNHSKFLSCRPSGSHNFSRADIIMGYGRSDRPLLPTVFSNSDPSLSHPPTSMTSSDFMMNSEVQDWDQQMSMYYEQVSAFRNAANIYKGHHSLSHVNSGPAEFEHEEQHMNVPQTNDSVLNHPGYSNDHATLGLGRSQDSESVLEAVSRTSHVNNHSSSGDILPQSPAFFDSRAKMEYSKEVLKFSESTTSKSGHQMPLSSERRSVEVNNLVNELDFAVNPRDFAAMTASTSSNYNNQFDYTSMGRSSQELDYRLEPSHDSSTYNINQEQQSAKYTSSNSLTIEDTDSANRRSTVWGYSEFQMDPQQQHQQLLHQHPSGTEHFSHNRKKLTLNEHGEKGPDFGMQFQKVGGHMKLTSSSGRMDNDNSEEIRHVEVQSSLQQSKDAENWGGRTRAHRKMARLLGQTSYNEKTAKPQINDSRISISRPLSFPKVQSSSNQASFREAHKMPDIPVKTHYPEESPQDLANSSQMLQSSVVTVRDIRTVSYPMEHDQGGKRDDDINRHQGGIRDFNLPASLGLGSEGPPSVSRDSSSLLANSHLLPGSQFDLDFPQTLSLDPGHDSASQDELFNHSIDTHHIPQQNLASPDNLNSQNSQELSLESYLNSTTDKDLDLMRKYQDQTQRELTTDNDFDFDEYIENSRLAQNYFERASNLPQDMTMYQKSGSEKFGGTYSSSSKMKEQDSFHNGKTNSRQTGLSDLHKEINKTSTKESMKGIRIPRDINRAMEILQDMQEDERAEERRKEELKKQLHNEMIEQKEQQHPMHHQHISINSSPKKTFQTKHQIESLNLTDQQFLGESETFMEEQSVQAVNFLEPPTLGFSETQQQSNPILCEPSLQDMPAYSAYSMSHQVPEMDLSVMSKRDHQQTDAFPSVLDNNIFKKLSLSNANKDQGTNASLSSIGISPMLNSNSVASSGQDLSFSLSGMPRFTDLSEDSLPNSRLAMPLSYSSINSERMRQDAAYQTKDGEIEKSQSFQVFRNNLPVCDIGTPSSGNRETNVLAGARQNLYSMVKNEQLCDAVLSVSQINIKLHQVVLCSMSHYLCNMISNAQQSSQHQAAHSTAMAERFGIVLMINCDAIKSSSLNAFLMFIYLGKTDFTESNVIDLFILASSLQVSPLKELCQEYMWKVHISEAHVRIPQVHVVSSVPGKQNLACQVNLGGGAATEDKCVSTGSFVKSMPVATQTDKSTPGVGRGGQEEWVMLKKTKQKTVSPSKTKYGNVGKCSSAVDTSLLCRTGKKGWLSPKRRFKTEHFAQVRVDNVEQDLLKEKFSSSTAASDVNNIDIVHSNSNTQQLPLILDSHPTLSKPLSLPSNSNAHTALSQVLVSSSSPTHNADTKREQVNFSKTKENLCMKKDDGARMVQKKTTVEIAEEAAAAKSAAHNYGTRFSGRASNKQCISYSALVHGYDKKRAAAGAREKPSLIKKKDFVKNHAAPTLASKVSTDVPNFLFEGSEKTNSASLNNKGSPVMPNNKGSPVTPNNKGSPVTPNNKGSPVMPNNKGSPVTPNSEASTSLNSWKLPVGKPLKKNIAQRAKDHDKGVDQSKTFQLPFVDSGLVTTNVNEVVTNTNVGTAVSDSSSSSVALVSEGDLTNVNSIIDSLVNTLKSAGGESDLQIVLNDFDAELGNALLTPAITTSTVSCTTPVPTPKASFPTVKEVSPSLTDSQLPLPITSSTSSSSSLSTSPSSSSSSPVMTSSHFGNSQGVKAKTTPQGFRKRLIQLMKSESARELALNAKVDGPVSVSDDIVKNVQNNRQEKENEQSVKRQENQSGRSVNRLENQIGQFVIRQDKETGPNSFLQDSTAKDHVATDSKQTLMSLEATEEKKGTDSASVGEGDLSSGTKYEEETQFHKIYKRKRKAKFRKSLNNDADSSIVKMRTKKVSSTDQEGGNFVKIRQRKNTANESDSGGSSRPKIRKTTTANDTNDNVLKVRPPPKKRAKMELELLKVANNKTDGASGDNGEGEGEVTAKTAGKIRKLEQDSGVVILTTTTATPMPEFVEADKMHKKQSGQVEKVTDVNLGCDKETKPKKKSGGKAKKTTEDTKLKLQEKDPVSEVQNAKAKSKKENGLKLSEELSTYVQFLEEKLKKFGLPGQLFSCNFCRVQFKSAQRTVKHIMTFHEVPGEEVLDHISIANGRKDQEACDICGYVTKDVTYKYMNYHKYFKHNVPLPKGWTLWKCKICDREFHTSFHLKEHVRSHSDNFFFVCWHCGQNFKTRNCLNSHVFHMHTKERKYLCKICQKTFKTWTQLKIHVRSHTGERPFLCPECNYGSTTQGNMRNHLVNRHAMDKSKLLECMKQISSKTADVTPSALEELMAAVLAKTIPDKAALKKPKKSNKRSPKDAGKHPCAEMTTTSSSVTAQMKAFLSDKIPNSSKKSPLASSSSSSDSNAKNASLHGDTKANKRKNPSKIAPKEVRPSTTSFPANANQIVILPPASTSASQDQPLLQANPTIAPIMSSGYTLFPSHLFPGFPQSSGSVVDGTPDQASSIVFVSPANLVPPRTVVEPQENTGFQILEVNSGMPQVNIVLNESSTTAATNPMPSQFSRIQFSSGAGVRGFANAGNHMYGPDPAKVVKTEDSCNNVSTSVQTSMGQYLVYANPASVGQHGLLTDCGQPGVQPFFISYPVIPGHQAVQGFPEMQLVPQVQEGVGTTSGDLVPILLSDQIIEQNGIVGNGEDEADGQLDEVVLTLEVSDVANSKVKKEEEVTIAAESCAKGQVIVVSSS